MLRVGNLEKSIEFYTKAFGMKLLRQVDYPEGKFTLVFIGYGNEQDNAVIELTYNYGVDKYELGNGFGHIALATNDIHQSCEIAEKNGGKVVRPPAPMKHGTTVIAFIEDPDGYKIELIQQHLVL